MRLARSIALVLLEEGKGHKRHRIQESSQEAKHTAKPGSKGVPRKAGEAVQTSIRTTPFDRRPLSRERTASQDYLLFGLGMNGFGDILSPDTFRTPFAVLPSAPGQFQA